MPSLSLTSFTRSKAADLISRISTGPRDAQGVDLEPNGDSRYGDISADGRYAVFETRASNLGSDPFLGNRVILYKDLATGAVSQVVASGKNPIFSPDGRSVLFEGDSDLLPGGVQLSTDIYIKDLQSGTIRRISAASPDAQGNEVAGDIRSSNASISADGRYVVFESAATNLGGGGDHTTDIFRKDLWTGAITLVSRASNGQAAADESYDADISADGRYVVFESYAENLVAGDENGTKDIFRKDLLTGAVMRVSAASRDAQGHEAGANGASHNASISADGRYVVFESAAANLVAGDTNGKSDVFRKDLVTGEIIRVSTGAGNAQANDDSYEADISPDGRYVVFESYASNLDGGDQLITYLFRKDLQTGEIVRIGAASGALGDDGSYRPKFSSDGHHIVFTSAATNLVDGDRNRKSDMFRVDNDLLSHRQAIAEGRYVKASFDVGNASSASIAWGDGSSETVTPRGGKVTFSHAYAAGGIKAATVTVKDGAQTWIVPHRIDVAAGQMSRDTGRADTLSGGAGGDTLAGDGFGNILAGHAGNDVITGLGGHDVLRGGEGRDRLYGGKGSASQDAFLFDVKLTSKGVANRHKDTVEDFGARYDSIHLDDAAFSNRTIAKFLKNKGASLDNPVKMKAGFFKKGAKATDRDDFFVYNDKTKKLYFDADGSGSKAMVEIAAIKLEAGAGKLGANDFFFV